LVTGISLWQEEEEQDQQVFFFFFRRVQNDNKKKETDADYHHAKTNKKRKRKIVNDDQEKIGLNPTAVSGNVLGWASSYEAGLGLSKKGTAQEFQSGNLGAAHSSTDL
jgi:hypothetical protein